MYPGTWLAMLFPVSASYTAFVLAHLLLTAVGHGSPRACPGRRPGRSPRGGPPLGGVRAAAVEPQPLAPLRGRVLDALGPAGDEPRRREAGTHRGGVARAALSLQVLAGSADACAMTLVLGATWVLVRLASRRGARRRAALAGAALAGALLLSVGLTAVVWWPAAESLSRSKRRDLPEDVRTAWSVPPAGLLRLLIPLDPGRVSAPRPRAGRFSTTAPGRRSSTRCTSGP